MAPKKSDGDISGAEILAPVNKVLLSIDYASTSFFRPMIPLSLLIHLSENQEMSDYMQEGNAGFKKPKVRISEP